MTMTDQQAEPGPALEPTPRAKPLSERAADLVPQPAVDVWKGKISGPAIRVILAAVGIPVAITVFAGSVPIGVYLNGIIVGSLYALIAIRIIRVYRANRIINFAQASLGSTPAVLGLLLV